MAKGKLPASEDMKVVVVTGDGAAYDIGLQSTAGAIDRRLDFYYLCYDNEAYGNTGFQVSSSTPYGSSTKTTPATADFPVGNTARKKDLFEVWRSMKAPYVATLANSHGVDFLRKVEKGTRTKGPKLFIALAACPTGWGFDSRQSVELEKLAVATGVWPLKESVDGVIRHTVIPRVLTPVEEYLKTQERFSHLFEPEKKAEAIAAIQGAINSYWTEAGAREGFQVKLPVPSAERAPSG